MNRLTSAIPLLLALAATLPGCATTPQTPAAAQAIAPIEYTSRFQAARDELLESGWVLDRVDSRAGVLTTQPRAGVVRTGQDVLDRLDRVVRVEFRSPGSINATDPSRIDLSEAKLPTEMRVRVFIQRTYYPGWRPSPTSVRLGGRHTDPELVKQDIQPRSEMTAGEDVGLAGEISDRIAKRQGQAEKLKAAKPQSSN
ncbi:MAG: hypothetical protein K2X32_04225 [Phycisphaerales bacterium]|nr:hypothetical protein [Phycisphaerales bacterium]